MDATEDNISQKWNAEEYQRKVQAAMGQIHVRCYEAEDGAMVVVTGNRRSIADDPKGGVMEAEFVFDKDGNIVTAHLIDARSN